MTTSTGTTGTSEKIWEDEADNVDDDDEDFDIGDHLTDVDLRRIVGDMLPHPADHHPIKVSLLNFDELLDNVQILEETVDAVILPSARSTAGINTSNAIWFSVWKDMLPEEGVLVANLGKVLPGMAYPTRSNLLSTVRQIDTA
jgi:hypothetical protein